MVKHFPGWLLILIALTACEDRLPEPERISIDGMINSVRVGNLLFGGQPSESALEHLAAEGYRTVLSARGEAELSWDEKAKVESLGITFVSIPMENPVSEITNEQVDRLAELMKNGERPMVLHCGSGNRISGLWAVWLVERQNVPPEKALQLAERTGMKGVRIAVEKRLSALFPNGAKPQNAKIKKKNGK